MDEFIMTISAKIRCHQQTIRFKTYIFENVILKLKEV